jgi:DNA repair exonuclease SbcCD ATPase subunit
LEAELEALNGAIKEQGRFLGVLLHFGSLLKLSKRRREVLRALKETQEQLRDTRQRWQKARTAFEEEQAQLREELQAALLHRSQLQTELDYLDDDEQRALLAHQRAVRHVLDALREPVALPDPALQERVNELVVLNVERERYLAGLEKAAHVLGLLSGIAKGVRAFQESVQKLIQQEQQYSQYLRPLQVTVPDAVQAFFAHFRRLDERVSNAERFREEPKAFTAHARAFIESAGDRQIQRVFEALGGALNQATETQWR